MNTRRLHQAFLEIDKLIKFLEKREYISADSLMHDIDTADDEIERIVNQALDSVRGQLVRHIEEETLWSETRMLGLDGTLVKTTKAEQSTARTILKRLRKADSVLLELRF